MAEFRLVYGDKLKMATFNGMSKIGAHDARIVFATWQTMGKNLKLWPRNHFELVIVDEAHHSEALTYKPVLSYFTGARLAITATPDRKDQSDIRKLFGSEVANIGLEEAIARGWLPKIEYHVMTDESLNAEVLAKITAEIKTDKRRFSMAEINRRLFIRKRDEEIARIIEQYQEKSIVFCESIPHANRMSAVLTNSTIFHSSTGRTAKQTWKKNQEVLKALRDGLVRRVCTVNAFNEGVNVPTVGVVAFCRVTQSLTIFRQQLGRGLRPGKRKLIVLDFVGNLERIQLILEMVKRVGQFAGLDNPLRGVGREGVSEEHFMVSGQGFQFVFSDATVDLIKILERCQGLYPTWQEASAAAIALGLNSQNEYTSRFREDFRLPSAPRTVYPDYPGDAIFFGRKPKRLYKTWQQASKAAISLGITSAMEYRKNHKQDPRLPAAPDLYPDFPGYEVFLGKAKRVPYPTYEAAKAAVQKMGIVGAKDYNARYKKDSRLPASPRKQYGADWEGWVRFCSRGFYLTVEEASKAAQALGIQSSIEYKERYKEDPRLPCIPSNAYKKVWKLGGWDWYKFLGRQR